jgi:hypothetical protein
MNIETLPRAAVRLRRRRFQHGSLQKRQSGGCWNWIAFWWESHHRRGQILGPCSTISRSEALAEMAKLVQPVNQHAGEILPRVWTLGDWIRDTFLPFSRRRWKLSTASTTGDRIRKHILTDLGPLEMASITRDLLQQYLEQKAARGHSLGTVRVGSSRRQHYSATGPNHKICRHVANSNHVALMLLVREDPTVNNVCNHPGVINSACPVLPMMQESSCRNSKLAIMSNGSARWFLSTCA